MAKFSFRIFALSSSTDFYKISSSKEDAINQIQFHFLRIFMTNIEMENQRGDIQNPQQNTLDIRNKINEFVQHYSKAEPKIHQLNEYFKQLKEDEWFFIYLKDSINEETNTAVFDTLMSLDLGIPYEQFKREKDELLKGVIDTYSIVSKDENSKFSIGEHEKNKRVCRFCGRKKPEVSFKTTAHAISESLGNKNIILNEECDDCNNTFGKGIEKQFIDYLSLFRGFYAITGKGKAPKIKGKNFKIHDNVITIEHMVSSNEEKEGNEPPTSIPADTYFKLARQSIYKTLVKYALSVIDAKYLADFTETIAWINGKRTIENLPKIAKLTSSRLFTRKPKITVYIRKEDSETLPYAVGEFHFTVLVFVFIIPLTNKDSADFLDKEEYSNYWTFFKHFNTENNWEFSDFSDNAIRDFKMNLNLEKNAGQHE